MSENKHLTSRIAGHGIGFPAGAIAVLSANFTSFAHSPLKSAFAVAAIAVGTLCVHAATKARIDFTPAEVVFGGITGAGIGAMMMLGVAATEEMAEPSKQRLIELIDAYHQSVDAPETLSNKNVCAMPSDGPAPAAPGCAP